MEFETQAKAAMLVIEYASEYQYVDFGRTETLCNAFNRLSEENDERALQIVPVFAAAVHASRN